jgi:hypothetical protein
MKVKYNSKPILGYYPNRFFTFGVEYKVIADYRQRQSCQMVRDDGFVVIDNQGQQNMLFPNEVEIIEDGEKCYTFSYSNKT